jgi:hypothetical protein
MGAAPSSLDWFVGMDCVLEEHGGEEILGFSWEGNDECDPACGRGWVRVKGEVMKGHLFFHRGDNSGFVAKKGNEFWTTSRTKS